MERENKKVDFRSPATYCTPLKEPLRLHQDVDVLNAAAVGIVQPLGQVGLQIGRELLVGPAALVTTDK